MMWRLAWVLTTLTIVLTWAGAATDNPLPYVAGLVCAAFAVVAWAGTIEHDNRPLD